MQKPQKRTSDITDEERMLMQTQQYAAQRGKFVEPPRISVTG
jgi:hypothetical protein